MRSLAMNRYNSYLSQLLIFQSFLRGQVVKCEGSSYQPRKPMQIKGIPREEKPLTSNKRFQALQRLSYQDRRKRKLYIPGSVVLSYQVQKEKSQLLGSVLFELLGLELPSSKQYLILHNFVELVGERETKDVTFEFWGRGGFLQVILTSIFSRGWILASHFDIQF